MPLALIRIDERLLHGQVVVGWGEHLELAFYLVVDPEIAGSDWEQSLWSAGLPDHADAGFVTSAEATEAWDELTGSGRRSAVLTRGTAPMRRLAEAGCLRGRTVNVGVLHDAEGRRRATDSVYLGPDELDDLRALEAGGARVEARDLPGSRPVSLDRLARAASLD